MRLFERETQLSILEDLLSASIRGSGRTAVIDGATGMGKTTLLNSFAEAATDHGPAVLSAASSRTEHTLQLGVISQLFRGAELPPGTAERVTRQLDKGVLAAMLPGTTAEVVGQMAAPLLHGLCNDLLDLAQQVPLVIVVDDAHHADALSLHCLAQLTRRARSSRILVVLTENPELGLSHSLLQAEILHRPDCRTLRLPPLTRGGVATALQAHLEGSAPVGLSEGYHALSGGNPLLLRALMDDHSLTAGGTSAEPVVGPGYEQAVLACLYRSGTSALRVAQTIAVLGDDASDAVLEACAKPDSGPVSQAVRVLSTTGLVDDDHQLRHEAMRTAVLNAMSKDERSRLHTRAAHVLYGNGAPAATVARHIVAADGIDAPWVVAVLREAGEHALADRQPGFAISCLRLALRTSTDDQQRVDLKIMMTSAQWQVDPLSVGWHLPELTTAIRDGHLVGHQAITPVSYLLWHGRTKEAAEALEHISRSAESVDAESALDLHFTRLSLPYTYPELARRVNLERRLPRGEERATESSTRPAIGALAALLEHDADDNALAKAERVLQGVPLDNLSIGPLSASLIALLYIDRLGEAASWCDSLLEEASVRAAPTWQAVFGAIRSKIALHQGDFAAAERYAQSALALISVKGWGVVIGIPLASAVVATTAMGRLDAAAEHLRVPVPEAMFQTPVGLLYLRARGKHHLARGQQHAALADFQTCGRLMTRWELDLPALLPWRSDLAHCYADQGDVPQARRLALEQLALLDERRSRVRGITLRALAAASGLRERLGLLREAAEILQDCGDQLELAHALAELSQTLDSLGDHGQARLVARRAHRVAMHCGAEPLQHMLRRHATEPPTAPRSGTLSGLSDAERRVAALASQGHTNRQIANRLYVTVSTVEQHLTHVYRKLNVKNRSDLPLGI